MNPKEKAEDLFLMYVNDGMAQIKSLINRDIRKKMAKQCALISVDEVLDIVQYNVDKEYVYWQDVKEEINKI
jgi:hypothetical protein